MEITIATHRTALISKLDKHFSGFIRNLHLSKSEI